EAIKRLDDSTYSKVQETIPKNSLSDLLSERREEIIRSIAQAANDELRPLGIAILDLRIRRTDYPESNLKKIFDRMRTERNRFALKYRAEGEEQALEIRSKADREGLVIQANAERASTRLHGEGDAEATRIYAEAYNQDAEFYGFLRSLEAYRKALDDQTTMVLSKDAPFLKHLFDPGTTSKKRR
ncbi:MAG: protease modulator HflC, partial [bacterium]|nr:protease modulator HflC [bacterium]